LKVWTVEADNDTKAGAFVEGTLKLNGAGVAAVVVVVMGAVAGVVVVVVAVEAPKMKGDDVDVDVAVKENPCDGWHSLLGVTADFSTICSLFSNGTPNLIPELLSPNLNPELLPPKLNPAKDEVLVFSKLVVSALSNFSSSFFASPVTLTGSVLEMLFTAVF